MSPESSPPPSPRDRTPEAAEFEQALADVEQTLHDLKTRYTQVQQDQQRQIELRHRREDIHQHLRQSPVPALKAELDQIQDQLDELEVNLESRLFTLGSLKEPFWQIVRFGGLGVILGWLLAFVTLNGPAPRPPAPNPATPSAQSGGMALADGG